MSGSIHRTRVQSYEVEGDDDWFAWTCSCGASSFGYRTRDDAKATADTHSGTWGRAR